MSVSPDEATESDDEDSKAEIGGPDTPPALGSSVTCGRHIRYSRSPAKR